MVKPNPTRRRSKVEPGFKMKIREMRFALKPEHHGKSSDRGRGRKRRTGWDYQEFCA